MSSLGHSLLYERVWSGTLVSSRCQAYARLIIVGVWSPLRRSTHGRFSFFPHSQVNLDLLARDQESQVCPFSNRTEYHRPSPTPISKNNTLPSAVPRKFVILSCETRSFSCSSPSPPPEVPSHLAPQTPQHTFTTTGTSTPNSGPRPQILLPRPTTTQNPIEFTITNFITHHHSTQPRNISLTGPLPHFCLAIL